MKGQWIGRNDHNSSVIILNMDEVTDGYAGYAFIHPDDIDLPRAITFIHTKGKSSEDKLTLKFQVMDRITNRVDNWEDVREKYSDDMTFQETALVSYKINGFSMEVSWEAENETFVSAVLTKSDFGQPSQLKSETMKWDAFKLYITQFIGKQFLFRGQNCSKRLRTSFHRAERCNFLRYMEHVKEVHWHISPKINHFIDLNTSEGLVSLMGIAQHHGYPTPLLDWTYSPYVAAYFAFYRVYCSNQTDCVRIFIFDSELWHTNMSKVESVWDPRLFVTVVKPLAIGNSRIVPQQATTTLTNVDDVEKYIFANQESSGSNYLHAIDIPMSERAYVMADLRFMGITAGSLFPGIDGSCEELREKHFGV